MNRHLLLVGPALAAGLMAATAANAQSAAGQGAVASTDLNMRAGPGPEYPVVGGIQAGDPGVQIIGCTQSGLWCDVTYDGDRGWAYARYLSVDVGGQQVSVPELAGRVTVPTATYEASTYFDQNYRDRPVYAQRDRYVTTTTGSTGTGQGPGVVTGAAGGAVTGALIGGPIGAAVGGIAGAALGATVRPPEQVNTYVTSQAGEPVILDGEVVVGAQVPDAVTLAPVPEYQYRYAYINGQRVLVNPEDRRIVYVYR